MPPPLLSIDRVSVARGDRALLNGVTLTLPEGRHTAILGRNGSGKSTLVQLITRQIYPTVGAGGDSGMTALLVSETMKYALIVIASGPILCLYPLLQRFFVKGVMLGAIKG